jgi:hypothetical protein
MASPAAAGSLKSIITFLFRRLLVVCLSSWSSTELQEMGTRRRDEYLVIVTPNRTQWTHPRTCQNPLRKRGLFRQLSTRHLFSMYPTAYLRRLEAGRVSVKIFVRLWQAVGVL